MSTLKVNILDTPSGSGNITLNRPIVGSGTLPAANLTGNLPAISGAALTNLPAGGDKRNFIIDGDMTQSPEGDITAVGNGAYTGIALWRHWTSGSTAVKDAKRSTDVPTVAQSGHQSKYSCHLDVTTADASVAASDIIRLGYQVTGSDFAYLHQQQVTLAFWVKDTKTGSHAVSFHNSAVNRSYVAEYTITTTNTWEYKTITLTMDTVGTFLFTEADIGMFIFFGLMVGTAKHATANTWTAGQAYATSSTVNSMDNTSNNFYLSQVGLYLGATAPTFLGESVAAVRNQVDYYVQRFQYDGAANETIASGYCTDTARSQSIIYFRREMRALPTGSSSTAGFRFCANACADVDTSLSVGSIGRHAAYFQASQSGTSYTAGQGGRLLRDTSDECFLMFDARH